MFTISTSHKNSTGGQSMAAPEKKFETKSAPVATGDSYNDKKSAVTPPSSVRKAGERLCKV